MDALTFYHKYGRSEAQRIAEEAGTNLVYYRQIMRGFYRPSSLLAWRLIKASGMKLTLEELCPAPKGLFDPADTAKEKAG